MSSDLRNKLNNIAEDHQECVILAKSMNSNDVYSGTTATASDIAMGKTAYSNGELIVGTMIPEEEVYSVEETVVGRWIDNRPIYRKVIIMTDLIRGVNKIAHNIENLGDVIMATGVGTKANGKQETMPRLDYDSKWWLYIHDISSTELGIGVCDSYVEDTDQQIVKAHIILKYTKTSDEATQEV